MLKRSTDRGRTWSKIQTIMDPVSILGATACPRVAQRRLRVLGPDRRCTTRRRARRALDHGAPAHHTLGRAVDDAEWPHVAGALSLWQTTSTDLGVTWSAPRNITADVVRPGDAVITPGNGHATQLASGRLLMAGYLRPAGDASEHCATIASDDHGKTWRLQPSNGNTGNGTSECEVVEIADGAGLP